MTESESLPEAWRYFQSTMEESRAAIERTERYRSSARHRSAIYRGLLQVQAMAYNFAVAPSVSEPRVLVNTTYHTNIYTLGLACQDFFYAATFLDGSRSYRLSGRLGAVKWISVQVQSHVFGDSRARNLGDFTIADLADSDGNFEVLVSAVQGDGPHIPLDPDSGYNFLWIRRLLADWHDDPGELRIEPVEPVGQADAPGEADIPSEADMADRVRSAADFASFLLNTWAIGLYDNFLAMAGGFNRPAQLKGAAVSDRDAGSPRAFYDAFVYQLAPDEALVITGSLPEAAYWGIQLGDVWSNALDFLNHPTDTSTSRISLDGDGRYRAVICAEDPLVANWLDTRGNREGIGMIRVFEARERPALPEFEVVKTRELSRALPGDTTYVSAAQRDRQVWLRREGLRARYGE